MLRPYQPGDLRRVTQFIGDCWLRDRPNNYHPGDFLHWMSSRYRGEGLERHFHVAEEGGQILAVAELDTGSGYYAFVADSRRRGGAWEAAFHRVCTEMMNERMAGTAHRSVTVNLAIHDHVGKTCLEAAGFNPTDADYVLLSRSLEDVPEAGLPEGFSIRSVAGEHEAQLVADVHNGAFGRDWTEAHYIKVMRTPGFDIERELIVTSPEGAFAAFAVIWPDPVSRTGLFEPVGCHRDFTRRGLARALLFAGMARMKAAGLEMALVGCEPSNAAARALYTTAGFKLFFETVDYVHV